MNRDVFVRLHIEDGEQTRDLQDVVHALGKVQQLQLSVCVFNRSVSADQLADPGAVDIVHVVQADNNLLLAAVDQAADRFPQQSAAFTQGNLAAEIKDCNVAYLSAGRLDCHGIASTLILLRFVGAVVGIFLRKFFNHYEFGTAAGRGMDIEFIHKSLHQKKAAA